MGRPGTQGVRLAPITGVVRQAPMKRVLTFGFVLMGFTFTVTQGLLIRELLVAFFGNELSIGLILGNWLILEAVGSGVLGRLAGRWGRSALSFALLELLFALFLPLCLYAAYTSRSLAGAIPGEGMGLLAIFSTSFLVLAPLGLVDGAMFAFGCRAYAHLTGGGTPSIGRVYVLEALGGIAGGIAFTYLMIPFLYSVQIVVVLSVLNLLAAGLIVVFACTAPGWSRAAWAGSVAALAALAIGAGLLLSPWAGWLQRWAAGRQWAGYDVVYSEHSVYGNVAVVERQGQYTFFADGVPVLTAPVPDVAFAEEMVHLPLLFVPQPRRALVLSGGVGGVIRELARYPLERIDYAELDPLLIDAVRLFPTPLTQAELADPRLEVVPVDGRLLVRQKAQAGVVPLAERYDLVVVNLPYPSTLQLNRFYTAEFFWLVRQLLADDGVLVLSTPGTLSYMSDEIRDLNAMSYQTLRQAFPYVRPIPGDTTLWLASPSPAVVTAPLEDLLARWRARGLETQLVTPAHIELRLAQRYLDWFWSSLDVEQAPGLALEGGTGSRPQGRQINRDLHPVGLFYGLAYWNALFSPPLARLFATAGKLTLWALGLPLAACALAALALVRVTGRGREAIVPLAIGTTGFGGMAADLIVIFAFQSLYGVVYQWIGLLITAFMAGLSLGGWLMTRRLSRNGQALRGLLVLEAALVLYWVLLPAALSLLFARAAHVLPIPASQALLLLLNATAGFLVGAQFPLANHIWQAGRDSPAGTGGLLYAADLIGAFLGSVLVAVVLVPVLGIVGTCLLAALLKAASLALLIGWRGFQT
jgi:spermidine synthase